MKNEPYCGDCPDRESCHQGTSCEIVRSAAVMLNKIEVMLTGKGNTIMSNNTKNITPADVAAKAVEEKLVTTVPVQGEGEKPEKVVTTVPVQGEGEKPEKVTLTVIEGEKKTLLKERLASLAEKLKENKKSVIAMSLAATAVAVAVAKVIAKRSLEQELNQMTPEDERELVETKIEAEMLAENA